MKRASYYCLPPLGVYVSRAIINNEVVNAITNIGKNPTIDKDEQTKIETYLIDRTEVVNADELEVILLEKIRDEQKFLSLKDLKHQITLDILEAKSYHEQN